MYTIGQFSRMGRIPAKTLRFYDEIDLLKPVRVDETNQYRYYSAEQLCDVLLISELKEYNFSLEEIKTLVHSHNPQLLEKALKSKLEEMDQQLDKLVQTRSTLKTKITQLKEGGTIMSIAANIKVELKDRETVTIAYVRRRVPLNAISDMITELFGKIGALGVRPSGNLMAIYYDEEFNPENTDIELAIPVAKTAAGLDTREMAGGLHASAMWVGPYSGLSSIYSHISKWIHDNDYEICNPPFDLYLVGPESTDAEEKYVTEVCFPIRKK